MAKLLTTLCPRCGAEAPVEPNADRATCKYCGITSFLSSSAGAHGPGASVLVNKSSGGGGGMAMILVVVALVAVCGVAGVGFMLMGTRSVSVPEDPPATFSPTIHPVSAGVTPVPAVPEAPTPTVPEAPISPSGAASARMLTIDVDSDGKLELVAAMQASGSDDEQRYVVFDSRTGAQRAQTPPIESISSSIVAVTGTRLVVAARNGQLTGYDLVSGDQQWTTTLGERVVKLCAAREAGSMLVVTDAERKLALDLTTGRQAESRDACTQVLARAEFQPDPRDRRDYSAPLGLDAWNCGTVRVMGSANFSVSDQCAARGQVRSDRLDGMVGHRIWRSGAGWLVFGVRTPGTYVPMVGRLERGRLVWKAEVPASNPLEAQQGGPRYVAVVGGTVVASYEQGSDRTPFLSAFAIADGTRRWNVPLADANSISDLVALEDAVAVRTERVIRVLSMSDGSARATIGSAD